MDKFESLMAALEQDGAFERYWSDLPGVARDLIERELPLIAGTLPAPEDVLPGDLGRALTQGTLTRAGVLLSGNQWDCLTPQARRIAAFQHDVESNPANREDLDLIWKLNEDIDKWEALTAGTVSEEEAKERRLAELYQEVDRASARIDRRTLGNVAHDRTSAAVKRRKLEEYIAAQPDGPINQTHAERALRPSGVTRDEIRKAIRDADRQREPGKPTR